MISVIVYFIFLSVCWVPALNFYLQHKKYIIDLIVPSYGCAVRTWCTPYQSPTHLQCLLIGKHLAALINQHTHRMRLLRLRGDAHPLPLSAPRLLEVYNNTVKNDESSSPTRCDFAFRRFFSRHKPPRECKPRHVHMLYDVHVLFAAASLQRPIRMVITARASFCQSALSGQHAWNPNSFWDLTHANTLCMILIMHVRYAKWEYW